MTLTVGPGPFGHRPAAVFNTEIPGWQGLLWLEPFDRRIRATAGEETIVDSRRVRMLNEGGRLPTFLFPSEDVRMDLLEPSERRTASENKGEARWWSLRLGERLIENATWEYHQPPDGAPPLAGLIGIEWDAMDGWLEEDEPAIVHPRDPYHRVDVLDTARHVRVHLGGETLAETERARVIFETSLPPRWYIPRGDVRGKLLEESEKRSGCAYKGFADYFSVRTGGSLEEDLAWTYREPHRDVARIAGYICFFSERVDIELDGELQERPMTPWNPAWRELNPEVGEGGSVAGAVTPPSG